MLYLANTGRLISQRNFNVLIISAHALRVQFWRICLFSGKIVQDALFSSGLSVYYWHLRLSRVFAKFVWNSLDFLKIEFWVIFPVFKDPFTRNFILKGTLSW